MNQRKGRDTPHYQGIMANVRDLPDAPPATHDGLQRPYSVYEDYEGKLYIIDKDGRIVLRDEFAYDDGSEARDMRMDKLADALNASAPSETVPNPPPGMLWVDEQSFRIVVSTLTKEQMREVCLKEGERLFKNAKIGAFINADGSVTPERDASTPSATRENAPWMPTKAQPLFNELALRDEIAKTWGAHGAHAEVYRMLLQDEARYRWLIDMAVSGDWGSFHGWKIECQIAGAPSCETLDQAIDAARGQ